MKKLNNTEQFVAEMHFDLNKNQKLPNKPCVTDDPVLMLVLHMLHGHEVVGAGRMEGHENTHFMFEPKECLNTHLEDWNKVASDNCSGFENLFTYMVSALDEFEKNHMIQLMTDIQTNSSKVCK